MSQKKGKSSNMLISPLILLEYQQNWTFLILPLHTPKLYDEVYFNNNKTTSLPYIYTVLHILGVTLIPLKHTVYAY